MENDSPRAALLKEALLIVTKQRNNQYGPPTQDFDRTALLWTALGFRIDNQPIKGHHVAQAMILLKMSRAVWSPDNVDHWTDSAGYSACGYEAFLLGSNPDEAQTE